MPRLTFKERGRLGGLKRAALYDGLVVTQKARDTYRASFLVGHECDLCGTIVIPTDVSDDERERRAKAARRFHYSQIALRSVQVRRERRAA